MTFATPKPRAGEHTKGPWRLNDHTADENCIYIEADHAGIATVFTGDEHDEANARRIVACVNACEGLSTSFLETEMFKSSKNLAHVANDLEEAQKNNEANARDATNARAQSDTLCEALAALIDGYSKWTTRQSNAGEWLEVQAKAKALLAKHGR